MCLLFSSSSSILWLSTTSVGLIRMEAMEFSLCFWYPQGRFICPGVQLWIALSSSCYSLIGRTDTIAWDPGTNSCWAQALPHYFPYPRTVNIASWCCLKWSRSSHARYQWDAFWSLRWSCSWRQAHLWDLQVSAGTAPTVFSVSSDCALVPPAALISISFRFAYTFCPYVADTSRFTATDFPYRRTPSPCTHWTRSEACCTSAPNFTLPSIVMVLFCLL